MFRKGGKVKIDDIGIESRCIDIKGDELLLELCGERFWMPSRLCQPID